jgi:hypothetical protein
VERVVGDVLGRFGSLDILDILVNDAAYSSRARVTIIYRVLLSLIRPRTQRGPVFLMPERAYCEDVMRDLKADWRRWTRGERTVAVFIAVGMSSMVPVLFLLSEG